MQSGGEPETLVSLLSSHYRGYSQMCVLFGNWLTTTGALLSYFVFVNSDDAIVPGMGAPDTAVFIEDAVKTMILNIFSVAQAQSIFKTTVS